MAKKLSIKVQPLGDRILVQPLESHEDKSPSGIYIPDTAKKEKSKRGKVLAVGEGRVTDDGTVISPAVAVGDEVFYNQGWDNEVEIDDEKYYLVKESDISAIVISK